VIDHLVERDDRHGAAAVFDAEAEQQVVTQPGETCTELHALVHERERR
jgi:hypothetical protein